MAKASIIGTSRRDVSNVVGRRIEGSEGRPVMVAEVNGDPVKMGFAQTSSQDGLYVATIRALRKAHQSGVTDLEIVCDDPTVANHMSGTWRRSQSGLHALQDEVAEWIGRFDSVVWR